MMMSRTERARTCAGLVGLRAARSDWTAPWATYRSEVEQPTVLALNPTDAATFDLTKTELGYIFATRSTGSALPLYGLTIIEEPHLTAPTLIDPVMLGVLYTQAGTIRIDPFAKADTNEVLLRVETNGLFVIRNVYGCYVIK